MDFLGCLGCSGVEVEVGAVAEEVVGSVDVGVGSEGWGSAAVSVEVGVSMGFLFFFSFFCFFEEDAAGPSFVLDDVATGSTSSSSSAFLLFVLDSVLFPVGSDASSSGFLSTLVFSSLAYNPIDNARRSTMQALLRVGSYRDSPASWPPFSPCVLPWSRYDRQTFCYVGIGVLSVCPVAQTAATRDSESFA